MMQKASLGGWYAICVLAASVCVLGASVRSASAQEAPFPLKLPFTPPNIPTVTLGGEQFWSDEFVRNGWRVQVNAMTGHHRLLDSKDVRHAWGTHDQCHAALAEIAKTEPFPPLKPKVVITLHGLIRSREAMEGIGGYLQKEGDYEWINV